MLNWSERYRQQQRYYFELLHQLVGKHKLKIWSGMFLSVTIIGALALVGLLDPGFDPSDIYHNTATTGLDSRGATSSPVEPVASPQRQMKGGQLFLVLLASTTAGWFIAYKLKHAGSPSKLASQRLKRKARTKTKRPAASAPKRKASRTAPPPVPNRRARPAPQLNPQPLPPLELQPGARSQGDRLRGARVPARLQPQTAAAVSLPALAMAEQPQVSVVPADTVMSLDRREPSLAEVLDLRKRRTMASIMGEMTDVG